MARDADLGERLIRQLAHFVPFDRWFPSSKARNVVVRAFRVYRMSFADVRPLPSAPLIIDLESVRAVFCRTELTYSDPKSWDLFPTSDGGFIVGNNQAVRVSDEGEWMRPALGDMWRNTGDGMVLLLLTPYPSGEPIRTSRTGTHMSFGEQPASLNLRVEGVTEDRLLFARAAIIAMMGRNAAFEELFEAYLRLGNGRARLNTHVSFNFPDNFGIPTVDGGSATVVEEIVRRMQSLGNDDRNRVALALRWYLRAQDFRAVKEVASVDSLISYWVAFESLAMPNENLSSAVRMLADVHRRPEAEIRQLLPLGRLFGLRGKILHHGQTPLINFELLNFMDDLFVDALLYVLEVTSPPKTRAYLDGSAFSFFPETSS